MSQSLFNKAVGPQQMFYRRLLKQLARTFNCIWYSKKYSENVYIFLKIKSKYRVTYSKEKSNCEITWGAGVQGCVPWNRCSERFRKNYRKTTALESLFNKAAVPRQIFYRRLRQRLARTLNGIWSSKKYRENVYISLKTKSYF